MALSPKLVLALCLLGLSLRLGDAYSTPQEYVAIHNAIRAQYGVGPVTWNQTLADYAQNYANSKYATCEMKHSGGPYGENLLEAYETTSAELTVKFWASESKFYDYNANKCVGGECGHFRAVVWRDTKQIGCAMLKCQNNWVFVICSYYPGGNNPALRPY
ncbi:basic form of pathogenesis-related protein 1-like [Momordica charantia]|uniref:Basic form of pathogenesis-related protein 1-like n=1 Tax=Momordica charantia TaxID=3673 RepID=A0A6J1D417_MOMCH|nr:basic form of pathogenesis-related protein 1-like [Momordica charantia]